jgi:hypothetical protein
MLGLLVEHEAAGGAELLAQLTAAGDQRDIGLDRIGGHAGAAMNKCPNETKR